MSSVHESLYERAVYQLEQLETADPDYDYQDEADFISELIALTKSSFTTGEAKRIKAIHAKYVGEG